MKKVLTIALALIMAVGSAGAAKKKAPLHVPVIANEIEHLFFRIATCIH